MTFLLEGASAVQLMLTDHTNPVKCLDDAMRKILQKNEHQDVKDLKDIRTVFSKAKAGKGRGAVGLRQGTTKTYSVQQVGEKGDLFIRLPVALLYHIREHKYRSRPVLMEPSVSPVPSI
jgi:hypothetical protein